jgi:Mg-chelatase subunit ChlI
VLIKERVVMRKKTNFEQVPVEVVKKIVEEQVKQEKTSETRQGVKKEELDQFQQLLLAANTSNRNGRRA